MSTRPWARGHEEALTIADGKGYLEGLGTIFKVARASALVKAIFACRASIPTCPRPRPQGHLQPFLQTGHRSESGQHRPTERALHGGATHCGLTGNLPEGRVTPRPQRFSQSQREDLRVTSADRSLRGQFPCGPLTLHDIGARLRVTSGSGHGPSLGQSQDSRIGGVTNYSRSGSYRSQSEGGSLCRSTGSSEVTS